MSNGKPEESWPMGWVLFGLLVAMVLIIANELFLH